MTTKSVVLLILLSIAIYICVKQPELLRSYSSVVQRCGCVACAHHCRSAGQKTDMNLNWGAVKWCCRRVCARHNISLHSASSPLPDTSIQGSPCSSPKQVPTPRCTSDASASLNWISFVLSTLCSIQIYVYPIHFSSLQAGHVFFQLLNPDWYSWKVLLTREAAGEGIWRRKINVSTEIFCTTSRQKIARETFKETQLIQWSWNKSRNEGKILAWI